MKGIKSMKYIYFDQPDEFVSSIAKFDTKRARKYFQWFMSVKDKRIEVLQDAV